MSTGYARRAIQCILRAAHDPRLQRSDAIFRTALANLTFSAATKPSDLHPEKNEDAFFVDEKLGVFGVFDGMGGHASGEVASRLAANAIQGTLTKLPANDLSEQLVAAFRQAYEAVVNHERRDSAASGLGTTAAVTVIRNGSITVAHVGDSRVYRLRGGELERLTEDDGLLTENLRRGLITSQQSGKIDQCLDLSNLTEPERLLFLQRNIVTKSISAIWKEPAAKTVRSAAGDVIALTTDGIHDNLTDAEIKAALKEPQPADALVAAAHRRANEHSARSKPDDLTAIVIVIS